MSPLVKPAAYLSFSYYKGGFNHEQAIDGLQRKSNKRVRESLEGKD